MLVPDDSSMIESLKAAGNEQLKAGKLPEALTSYTAALDKDPEKKHADASALLANRALVYLKLSQPEKSKEDCTAALAINPRYGKAYYRRAQACEAMNKLADAFKDVRMLMQLEPTNKEAVQLAAKLKRAMEERAAKSDLSTPTQAVEMLRTAAAGSDDQLQAAGKLSRIAEDGGRSAELVHAGAVEVLVQLLPSEVAKAADISMPIVGLAIEALDRMSGPEDKAQSEVLKAMTKAQGGSAIGRLLGVATAAAEAGKELGEADAEAAAAAIAHGLPPAPPKEPDRVKNLLLTARRSLSLLASAAGCRSALGTQDAQGMLVVSLLPFLRHHESSIARAGQDGLIRVVDKDKEAASAVLPQVFKELIWLLGDEESQQHKMALGVLSVLMAKIGGSKDGKEEGENTPALSKVCESVLSPILRCVPTRSMGVFHD